MRRRVLLAVPRGERPHPELVDAWQLRVRVRDKLLLYRFTRPEAAAEVLELLAPRLGFPVDLPTPEEVVCLRGTKVLRRGSWSIRYLPVTQSEFNEMETI